MKKSNNSFNNFDLNNYLRRTKSIVFFVSVLIFYSNVQIIASNGTEWANDINVTVSQEPTVSKCGSGATNCFKIEVTDIPIYSSPNGINKGYSCFWHFGDGEFLIDSVLPGVDHKTIYHQFRVDAPSKPYLQLTKRYTDEKKPKKLHIDLPGGGTVGSNGNGQTASDYPLGKLGSEIQLIPSLKPRAGDIATYALSYDLPACDIESALEIKIELDYDNGNKVTAISDPDYPKYYYENGDPAPYTSTVDDVNKKITFTLSPPPSEPFHEVGRINAFIDFTFDNIEEGDTVWFNSKITGIGIVTCAGDEITNTVFLVSTKSHDPNKMVHSLPHVCPSTLPDSMDYTIIFQNIGKGEATTVIVRNIVPEYFHILQASDINTINPSGIKPTFNPLTREIEWAMFSADFLKREYTHHQLKGTAQAGFEMGSAKEHHTIDSIEFRIGFDHHNPPPFCGAIINRAEIFFDNNTPIMTKNSYLPVQCDSCDGCDTISKPIEADPVFMRNGQPTDIFTQVAPNMIGEYFHFYPSAKLINNSGSPMQAMVDKSGIYTLVSINDCDRKIFQIPVIDESAYPAITEDCNWWKCTVDLSSEPELSPKNFIWHYRKNGKKSTHFGKSLNASGVDSAFVLVVLPNGKRFVYEPCLSCWKITLWSYKWCFIIIGLLLLWLLFRAFRKNT